MTDSARWCDRCQAWGDHHTDRCTTLDDKTKAELEECIRKMKAASSAFYVAAIQCEGNHAFIEFTGLMNEYIAVCEDRMRAGIDFRFVNKHCGNMPLADYRLAYLNEKIDCIYGVEFRPKVGAEGVL